MGKIISQSHKFNNKEYFHKVSPTKFVISKYDERGEVGLDYCDLVKCRKALGTKFGYEVILKK